MQVTVDGQNIFELTEIQKQVICNDINEDVFDTDMKRRLEHILVDKYDNCFKRLKMEWDVKLVENGVTSLPVNKDEYAQLVFSQPNYKSRKDRDQEENMI